MVAFQADQNAYFQAEGAAVSYFIHRTTDPYELKPAGGGTNERGAKRAAVQQQVDLLAAICSQTRSMPREQASE
jgi:hypothetical protein